MSRFFKVLNTTGSGGSSIDDGNISTDTTYSSFQINQLITELSSKLIGCNLAEYPGDIRASPQRVFETPDNSNATLLWVLREGVKMTKGIDYTVTDNTHIEFLEDVSEKYTVSILVIGNSTGDSTSIGTGVVNNSSVPFIFVKSTPITSWNIKHDIGFQYPRLDVIDDLNNRITDSVTVHYDDDNNCTITSEIPFMGKCIVYP